MALTCKSSKGSGECILLGALCKFYISGLSKRILHKFMALLGFRVSKVQGSEILGLGRALSSPVMQHTRPCTDTLVAMQEDPREIGGFFPLRHRLELPLTNLVMHRRPSFMRLRDVDTQKELRSLMLVGGAVKVRVPGTWCQFDR